MTDGTQYKWHKGEKVITDGRMQESPEGVLIIENVALTDVGDYSCTLVFLNPDTSSYEQRIFNHTFEVVTIPKIAIQALIHYKAKTECTPEILELFDLYLPQLIQKSICDFGEENNDICLINVYNPLCFKNDTDGTIISLNVQMDVKGIDYLLIVGNANKTVCSPMCHQKLYLKTSLILKESLREALLTTVFGRTSFTGADFNPLPTSWDLKMTIGCEAGFHQVEHFCVPCPPHSFSNEGSTKCTKCSSGSYQPQLGSRACLPCPSLLTPGCNIISQSRYSGLKKIVAKLSFVALLTLLVCYCVAPILSYIFSRDKWKSIPKKISKVKPRKKEDKISKQRLSSHKKNKLQEIEELEEKGTPSLQGSDDTTEFSELEFSPSVTERTRTAGSPPLEDIFVKEQGIVKRNQSNNNKSKTIKEMKKSSKDLPKIPRTQQSTNPGNSRGISEDSQRFEKSVQTYVRMKTKPALPEPDFT